VGEEMFEKRLAKRMIDLAWKREKGGKKGRRRGGT